MTHANFTSENVERIGGIYLGRISAILIVVGLILTACGSSRERGYNPARQSTPTPPVDERAAPLNLFKDDYSIDESGGIAFQKANEAPAQQTQPAAPTPTPTSSTAEAIPTPTPTPSTAEAAPEPSPEELIDNGETHFSANCVACHQSNGQGIGNIYPALAGNDFVTQEETDPLINLVLKGRGAMPSFQNQLSNQDIAEVLSYIRNTWGNEAPVIRADAVEAVRAAGGSD